MEPNTLNSRELREVVAMLCGVSLISIHLLNAM